MQRVFKRVLIPFVILAYLLLTFFQFHTRNIFNTTPINSNQSYKTGIFDDLRILKCYKWYKQCNQIMEGYDSDGNELIWNRVEKNLDIYGQPPNFWSIYTEYLYVHIPNKGRFGSTGRAIVDLALGDPMSKDPPFYVVNDAQTRITKPKSRLDATFNYKNWELKSDGIWAKYDRANSEDVLNNIQYFFGNNVVDPRQDWKLLNGKLRSRAYLSIHRGSLNSKGEIRRQVPILTEINNEFKIIQISDLHFNSKSGDCKDQFNENGAIPCKADSKTLNFINEVLDIETPDFAIITGDLLDGFQVQDYQTAILKALNPLIKRSIPFAIAFGDNDVNEFASKYEIIKFISDLPMSMMDGINEKQQHHNSIIGFENNYAFKVFDSQNEHLQSVIYVLDLFQGDQETNEQSKFLYNFYNELQDKPKFSLEFQHQPIQEYRPKSAFAIVGKYNEKGKLNINSDSNLRKTLSDLNVNAMSVGYEHTNECCIHGEDNENGNNLNPLWMCYGGATGEGGYGNKDINFERRVRFFRINSEKMEITSWKRKQTDPQSVFDYQYIYN
ncbi:hypothetical protein BN7_814 [Wickerhamomyces ciferrii]|uniref:Calcineurin-like phosphoesterase domain-containing protein n=1 Tax=Wickerhamomyces ciferrii (strain ATCC 14091 / BCRC 22168 / CBS 111 / JCM 3599 / NBRC 0793 / NRRL Y-1031 F-60-10) TaxID=1206466 RepID=K0KJM1_WICCF|nr:uncharacterized protein BN7_814 [Wickerhamomyces ciferrii]CCH41278.1 hypothetical protein BN7_814 [Wickerhamomyces ciferrii]